jgi:hypothetical protein
VDIADYLRILRARWLLVACFVVVAVGAAWLTTSVVPIAVSPATVYRASAVMLKTGDTGGLSLTTLATVTTIEPVAEQVAEAIGYRRNPLSLTDQIQAVGDDQGGLLTITATDTDPGRTELLANQFAKQLVAYLTKRSAESSASQAEAVKLQMDDMNRQISNLEGKILIAPKPEAEVLTAQRNALITTYGNLSAQYQSLLAAGTLPIGLETLQEANATPAPLVGLQPPRSRVMRSLLAALIGLLLGAGAAIGLEQIRGRIRTKPAGERAVGAPGGGESDRRRRPTAGAAPRWSARSRSSAAVIANRWSRSRSRILSPLEHSGSLRPSCPGRTMARRATRWSAARARPSSWSQAPGRMKARRPSLGTSRLPSPTPGIESSSCRRTSTAPGSTPCST